MRDRTLLFSRAKIMRREPTLAEREMWRILRGRRMAGLKFRRQVPLGNYIADFACLDPKVIVECDGGQHADSAYDAKRDEWFRTQGFQMIRIGNRRLINAPEREGLVDELLSLFIRP